MKKIKYVEKKYFENEGKRSIYGMDILLDIGCGIMPQQEYHPKVHICAEPFTQYVEVLQKKITKDVMQDRKWIILQNDFNQILDTIPDNSVDTIMMIDVIEHIEKEEVKKQLTKMLKKVRQQCVIVTPLGFMPQEHETSVDAWGLNGAEQQVHLSGWEPEDFEGADWEFVICKEYHLTNNMDEKLDQAYGRLYAIYTNPEFIQRGFIKKLKIYLLASLYSYKFIKYLYSYKLIRNLYSKFKKIVK
tara:strand:- start:1803 stop:2537 length:735 start_codon:yes stop_codon:yes gene_type:complete